MPRLGAHMSIAGGVSQALERGRSIGCDAIQIFTKNQRRWVDPDIRPEEIAAFKRLQTETGIGPIISHDAYLINIASPNEDLWRRSVASLIREMERCEALGVSYLNMHPGSHTGAGEEVGMRLVAQGLDEAHAATPDCQVMTLLETTAGQGTNLGYTFQHLRDLMEMVAKPERVGVCFDTCHTFAAGYELRTAEGCAATFRELDDVIGLDNLRAFHLNGSLGGLGSRLDRHTHISEGELGLEVFRMLLNDPRFAEHPMVLETPKGEDMKEDVMNLGTLRDLLE